MMRDFFEAAFLLVMSAVVALGGLALTALAIATPFIALGLGLGAMGWTFCLFVSFC